MNLSISAVAREAGLQPSAIRYYERVGLLAPPPRISGRRRYDRRVLRQLAVIGIAQQAGFSIAEIRTLLHGFTAGTPAAARWRALAERKLPEIDALISRAHEMRRIIEASLQCGSLSLVECALRARSVQSDCCADAPGVGAANLRPTTTAM